MRLAHALLDEVAGLMRELKEAWDAIEDAAGEEMTPTINVRERIMGVDFSGTTPVVITPNARAR